MKDENEIENKGLRPSFNKDKKQGMVRIKINHNRAIAGVGGSDEVVTVSELDARLYVASGLATIIKES